MTGLDIVKKLFGGKLQVPPMASLLPFRLQPPSLGRIELHATPDQRVLNPTNTVHAGWTMTMLDTAMWLAALTTLEPGKTAPTHETSAKFVRSINLDVGQLKIYGQIVSRGRSVITLEGRVEDMGGLVFAHGTSTCLVVSRAG